MARFCIGQPVRIARNLGHRAFDRTIGMESVVVATNVTPTVPSVLHEWKHHGRPVLVQLRDFPSVFLFAEDELEPVVPPGLESNEEINKLFAPDICEVDIT